MEMYTRYKYMTASETVSLEEANERLADTTVFLYQDNKGKYMWMAIMYDSPCFDTLMEAYNDAVDYINNYGC